MGGVNKDPLTGSLNRGNNAQSRKRTHRTNEAASRLTVASPQACYDSFNVVQYITLWVPLRRRIREEKLGSLAGVTGKCCYMHSFN